MWRSWPVGGAAAVAGVSWRAEEAGEVRPGEKSGCKEESEDDKGRKLRDCAGGVKNGSEVSDLDPLP